jgi:hypothetical protein
MQILGRISPLYFFIAFAVGLMACYVLAPKTDVVVRFPSPFNAGKVVYHDKEEGCFVYNADEVECPADGVGMKKQPAPT